MAFPRGCWGSAASEDPLGDKVPKRKAEASTQKIPTRQASPEMGGKADRTASSPDTDQGPKGTDKDKPSSQYMKALQGQLIHQSLLHTCRQPKRNGLKAQPTALGHFILLTAGAWLYPVGTRGAPAKIVPVVSRQGSHAHAHSLPPRTQAEPARRSAEMSNPERVGSSTSQRLGQPGKAHANDTRGRAYRNRRVPNLHKAVAVPHKVSDIENIKNVNCYFCR